MMTIWLKLASEQRRVTSSCQWTKMTSLTETTSTGAKIARRDSGLKIQPALTAKRLILIVENALRMWTTARFACPTLD